MRILRGKSNLEVSSHGFALFVFGLIIATFVGGAVRTLLGSDRVHQRILSELRTRFPTQEISMGSTEVLLSRGIWPGLGLKITALNFKDEACGKLGVTLEVPTVILPISLWSLRGGNVRLGNVELISGRAHLNYKTCAEISPAPLPPVAKAPPAVATPPSPAESQPAKVYWNPPQFDWKQIGKNIGALELTDLQVTFEHEPTWKVHVRNAEFDFSPGLHGHAVVDVQKSLPFGALTHLLDIEAHGEDSVLEFQVISEFKEGRVKWTGSWDSNSQAAMSSVDISQLPIKELLNELYLMGLTENEIQIKTAWLSCKANWEGSMARLDEMPVRLRACKMEGAYGGVQMEQADVYPLQADRLKVPVQFKIQNLQVQPLVEALNKQFLPAVINRLGVWSGQFEYLNKNSWSLDGFLDGAEVVFSNQSVRGKQQLRRVHTVAHRVEGLTAAKVDQVEISDGQWKGIVEAALNDDLKSGTFSIKIENIAFSPGIQTLLTGGTWNELRLTGSGHLQNGEVSEWKGVMESPKMEGAGWVSLAVVANSKYQPGLFQVEARMSDLELGSQWRYYPQVGKHLGADNKPLKWKDIRTKVEVKKTGGEIQSFSALEAESGRMWRGRGNWQRERDLVAVLSGMIENRPRNFTIRAEKGFLTMDEGRTP